MSNSLAKRVEKLEQRTDDVAALVVEFHDVLREWLSGDAADAAQRAQPLLERVRVANERKPDLYLDYMLTLGEMLLESTP